MSNIPTATDLSSIKDSDEFIRFASTLLSAIVDTVNGNLEFSNMIAETKVVTFPAANTNTPVPHGLKKTGVNYIVVSLSAAMTVYRGTDDTKNVLNLKATAAGSGVTATVILF